MHEHQLPYTLLCKTSGLPWTLTIYLLSGIYRTVKDVIHGLLRGQFWEETSLFCVNEKAQNFFELKLTPGWFVTLPKTLARALGYLNHLYNIPQP